VCIQVGKNQYLFTSRELDVSCSAKVNILGYWLYLGADCKLFNYQSSIYVIGYAVDVCNPEKSLEEMCESLLSDSIKGNCGPQATRNWNGRYVIISVFDKLLVWHDCCGLKQVFYSFIEGKISLASQARYIAEAFGLEKDGMASEYLDVVKKTNNEYSWVLGRTNYKNVKRLLPNHIIDTEKALVFRSGIEINRGSTQKAVNYIRNSLIGASKIKPLCVTITAGLDSRLVLAGCKNIDEYKPITLKYDWMKNDNKDISVAQNLCKIMGLSHVVCTCKKPEKSYLDEYFRHSENGHEYWAQMAYAVTTEHYSDFFWVKGSCNEIIRNSFGVLYNWQVNASMLCKLYGLPKNTFVMTSLNEWLDGAKSYCNKYSIKLLDLFYWEHRMGCWLAECLNEADFAGETFTPFNCRAYLENGLGISYRYRIAPKYMFFQKIMRNLCEEVVDIPINEERYQSLKAKIAVIIKSRLHIIYGILLGIIPA